MRSGYLGAWVHGKYSYERYLGVAAALGIFIDFSNVFIKFSLSYISRIRYSVMKAQLSVKIYFLIILSQVGKSILRELIKKQIEYANIQIFIGNRFLKSNFV